MQKTEFAAVVMAAGKSTRMKSRLPKPLHKLCGQSLLSYILEACQTAGASRQVVIVGHGAEMVKEAMGEGIDYALQAEQKGTGHAVMMSRGHLLDYYGDVLVLPGDIPLITAEVLTQFMEHHRKSGAMATLLSAVLPHDAGSYGRIVRDDAENVLGIIEAKDASDEQRLVREINSSIYVFNGALLYEALGCLKNDNSQGEYYLTDVIGWMREQGHKVDAWVSPDWEVILGMNTRLELADLTTKLQKRILNKLMLDGVTIIDPANTYIDSSVKIGADTIIEPGCHIHGLTVIGEQCVVGPDTRLIDAVIADSCEVAYSQIKSSELKHGVTVGPFANIRPGCVVGPRCKIGDFVELKGTVLEERVSAGHLSYLGDAEIGAGTNIGAGTITCNYDGIRKHKTRIGKRCFVGSHSTLVAPVQLGDEVITAAGSTITDDVPESTLAIGRSRQLNKEGWVAQNREKHFKKEHH